MRRTLTVLVLGLAFTALGFAACGVTAGVPITLSLAFEGIGEGRVTTASGWEVELTEARAVLGPVYAYAPADEPRAALRALAPLGVARAHGGFDPLEGRVVRAEYLDQIAVDLLGAPAEAGLVMGLEGAVDELTVGLDAPLGALAASDGPTRGHHLWVAGTARRDGAEVSFEGGLDFGEQELERRVDGVVIEGPPLTEGARLVVGVDPDKWLLEADFEQGVLTQGSQPYRAWLLEARLASTYAGRIEGGE